jgi:HAD superfamily hydrolase (TIGR01509 family)
MNVTSEYIDRKIYFNIPGGRIVPMPLFKAILWDMDGVLADTSQLHFETWERVLTKQGIAFDRQKFHHIYGLKNHDLLPYLTGKPLEPKWIDWIADQKELAFRQSLPGHLSLLPGVLEWLQRFNSWGWKQAVASSAPPENVDALVDELGIRQYFADLITPGDLPGKPNPAVFLLAASRLGVPPDCCIVIEDSIPGVDAARRAGMHCIAVTTTNPPEALTQADIVVTTMDQLTVKQLDSLFC